MSSTIIVYKRFLEETPLFHTHISPELLQVRDLILLTICLSYFYMHIYSCFLPIIFSVYICLTCSKRIHWKHHQHSLTFSCLAIWCREGILKLFKVLVSSNWVTYRGDTFIPSWAYFPMIINSIYWHLTEKKYTLSFQLAGLISWHRASNNKSRDHACSQEVDLKGQTHREYSVIFK